MNNSVTTRRQALQLGGVGAAAVGLAACGVSGTKKVTTQQAESAAHKFWRTAKATGSLNFASWAAYIDPKHQSLKQFTQSTGISVNYQEVIQDDNSWFAKVDPMLRTGQYSGYDLMIITDGFEFNEFVQLGEVIPLDRNRMPHVVANITPKFTRESFDPGNVYSVPWASGMTGIAWNSKYVKEPITSIDALWNPKYQGKVGMMKDPQELANYGLFKIGVKPEHSAEADWHKAADALSQQRSAGIVRQYYGQDYLTALSHGDIWVTMGWSGDIFQQNQSVGNNDLQFVIPQEGGTLWTDNMMIPKYCANPVGAMQMIDWFYRPEIATLLTENIQYINACEPVLDMIKADAARSGGANGQTQATLQALTTSALVFPPAGQLNRLSNYVTPVRPAEADTFKNIFNSVSQ
jgi:spermidine/putrescine transport system substrate-binding protein